MVMDQTLEVGVNLALDPQHILTLWNRILQKYADSRSDAKRHNINQSLLKKINFTFKTQI